MGVRHGPEHALQLVARLRHAKLVQLHEVTQLDGAHCVVVEHVWGADLSQVLRRARQRRRRVPLAAALRIGVEVCEALEYVHSAGLVCADLRPEHVRVRLDGVVKLRDLGLFRVENAVTHVRGGMLRHRTGCMSPEQLSGRPLDARTDLFALGAMLYELLTGTRPFVRDSDLETLRAIQQVDVRPPASLNPELSASLNDVVLRALAREPADRFPDATALRHALEQQQPVASSAEGVLDPEDHEIVLRRLEGAEHVRGVLRDDGTVTLENETTGARYFVARDDVLIVSNRRLEIAGREMGTQLVANGGMELVQLAERVAAAAHCRVRQLP